MTYLLSHNNENIIWGILDTFSIDTIITIFSSIHKSVFFVLRLDAYLVSLFLGIGFEYIP